MLDNLFRFKEAWRNRYGSMENILGTTYEQPGRFKGNVQEMIFFIKKRMVELNFMWTKWEDSGEFDTHMGYRILEGRQEMVCIIYELFL